MALQELEAIFDSRLDDQATKPHHWRLLLLLTGRRVLTSVLLVKVRLTKRELLLYFICTTLQRSMTHVRIPVEFLTS